MEILQLRYFCSTAQTEKISKTAEIFMVPVSSVSQSIKRLETELGYPLFERTANRIRLNEAGETFYREVKKSLELLDGAVSSVRELQQRKVVKINAHLMRWPVMDAIEKFHRSRPDVKFEMSYELNDTIGQHDILITDRDLDTALIKTVILEEPLAVAFSSRFFSVSEKPTAQELSGYPYITTMQGSSSYECLRRVGEGMGFSPKVVLQSADPFYVRSCVELGIGISVVPEVAWRGRFTGEMQVRRLEGYTRKVYAYRKSAQDPCLREFHDLLVSELRRDDNPQTSR